jgi:hypothetical protein
MIGACSTQGNGEKLIRYFVWKNMKGSDHSEDLDVDGRIYDNGY